MTRLLPSNARLNLRHPLATGIQFGMVGQWPGSLAGYDSSPYKRNGTLLNGPTWVTGEAGPAIRFDAADERVEVVTANLPADGVTVFQRARTIGTSPNFVVYGVDSDHGWVSLASRWTIYVEISAGSYIGRRMAAGNSLTQDVWYSLAFTIAAGASANSDVALYVDAVRVDANDDTDPPYQSTGKLWIGSRFPGYNANCEVASTIVYDRVFSVAEIRALCDESKRGYPELFNRRSSYAVAVGAPSFVPYPYPRHELTGGMAT